MDKREDIPQSFKDVSDEIRSKARTLAITVLNMEDVEMVTGFMAGVLLHASNTLIEEQAARIAELEKERDVAWESREWHRVSMECQTENLIESQASLSEAVKVLERLAEGEMSDTGHTALRDAAKAFIATLGEAK